MAWEKRAPTVAANQLKGQRGLGVHSKGVGKQCQVNVDLRIHQSPNSQCGVKGSDPWHVKLLCT
jgi:hypothetical protein